MYELPNPKYSNDMFIIEMCKYDLRGDSLVNKSTAQATNHGLHHPKKTGPHLESVARVL